MATTECTHHSRRRQRERARATEEEGDGAGTENRYYLLLKIIWRNGESLGWPRKIEVLLLLERLRMLQKHPTQIFRPIGKLFTDAQKPFCLGFRTALKFAWHVFSTIQALKLFAIEATLMRASVSHFYESRCDCGQRTNKSGLNSTHSIRSS